MAPDPSRADAAFGPDVVYAKTAPSAEVGNPTFCYEVAVDGDTGLVTVRLRDVDGAVLRAVELAPPHDRSVPD